MEEAQREVIEVEMMDGNVDEEEQGPQAHVSGDLESTRVEALGVEMYAFHIVSEFVIAHSRSDGFKFK